MLRRRRALLREAALLGALAIAALVGDAQSAAAQGWRSAQPMPPPAPEGQTAVGAPVPLGHVGQISFWAPNRGLLITAGNHVVPEGLYYYNGVSWRQLSTVCGGTDGRIAWAGPDDFWTIADQQHGQQLEGGVAGASETQDVSLCHFQDGKVIASYAQPIGVVSSYQQMHAAACSGPNNCWFAGVATPEGLNGGAFHLHWNGQTVTQVPSSQTVEPAFEDPPFTVWSLAYYRSRFYESVETKQLSPGENPAEQASIHRIAEGSSKPFASMTIEGTQSEPFSPRFESIFQLSADERELWAVDKAGTALLLNAKGQFQQMKLNDQEAILSEAKIVGVAADPGTEDAWVSLYHREAGLQESTELTRVAKIHASVSAAGGTEGSLEAQSALPQAGETIAHKGAAGAIACAAPEDCWVASSEGWLFHLGGDQPEDDDPYFQKLITYRPPDASIPFVAPESFPEDNSGDNPPPLPAPPTPPPPPKPPAMAREALFSHVKARLIGHTTLALTFTLATKSQVKLLALRKRRIVARTGRYTLGGGSHTLKLRLHRDAWPTKLQLRVKAIGKVPLVTVHSKSNAESGEPNAVAT
jgi:hypothetical protein